MKKFKVRASGNGVQGKIIINGSSHHRVIPVLAFSEKNAQLLLDAVDKLERINNMSTQTSDNSKQIAMKN